MLSQYHARAVHISEEVAVNHDLDIKGEDAWELFAEIHKRYGTRFETLNWDDYFVT